MIRSHFGLELNPFDTAQKTALLPHQQDIFETIKVHCQQGGLCPRHGRARHREERHQARHPQP